MSLFRRQREPERDDSEYDALAVAFCVAVGLATYWEKITLPPGRRVTVTNWRFVRNQPSGDEGFVTVTEIDGPADVLIEGNTFIECDLAVVVGVLAMIQAAIEEATA